jgi:hypothetical protein
MVPFGVLSTRFEEYSAWRNSLAEQVLRLREWLDLEELGDPLSDQRIDQVLANLREDHLVVAEFSRGKSELINAIFFANFGQRLLPSSAGRTTMCPTELLFDSTLPPCVRLLPIETRGKDAPVSEYKRYREEWTTLPLDLASADHMGQALASVSQTLRVPTAVAREYGLYHDDDALNVVTVHTDGTVEIPRWRHAIINFPHPLLKQGLVILDTPGLNAIGSEPELTLNLLPNAHAILFILAADTGVTKTDIEVWRNHIMGSRASGMRGRLAVLNKIDGLWDELKSNVEIAAELKRQVQSSADLLGLNRDQIFPVSAQKALVAKVNGDDALLEKSRLPALEAALSQEMIPAKREIVSEGLLRGLEAVQDNVHIILRARLSGLLEQLSEFRSLRGKNQDVVAIMLDKAKSDRSNFEKGLQQFVALRSVFTQHSNMLFTFLGKEAVRTQIAKTQREIDASAFTRDVRAAMTDFFTSMRSNIDHAAKQIGEVVDMMNGMYEKFSTDYGLEPFKASPMSTLKYRKELERLERTFNVHFNTLWNMLSSKKATLQRKFFDTVTTRVMRIFDVASRDAEQWVKAVMTPLESEVREYQLHHRRRMESIKRIHNATEELEERIEELEQAEQITQAQLAELAALLGDVRALAVRSSRGVDLPDERLAG